MIKLRILSAVTILSSVIATQALAQAAIQEPGAYAFSHPNGDLGIGNTRSGASAVVRRTLGAADAMASTLNSRRYVKHPSRALAATRP